MRTKKSSRWHKGLDQDDLKLITAIRFDVMSKSHSGQSEYLYIPTRYMNDETSGWLTANCRKNIKTIYFPKMIRLFKKIK